MPYYHPFKKTVKGKNGKAKRVFYYWYEEDGVQKQRVIKDKSCKTLYDATIYCSKLPQPTENSTKIKAVAADMFIPGGEHLQRRGQMGLSCKQGTIANRRYVLEAIIKQFGERNLETLSANEVFAFLVKQQRAPGWKNLFTSVLREVYQHAAINGADVPVPNFPKFKGSNQKADPLFDSELSLLLNRKNFSCERNYVLFLLMTSAGLRVSEARAFQARQFLPDLQMVLVDGSMTRDNKTRNPYNKCGTAENPRWRLVVIPKTTADALAAFIFAEGLKENDFVFTTPSGKTLRINAIRCAFFSALQRAGISADGRCLRVHSLRYTFVTRTREYLNADVVRQMAGHTKIDMTDYYTRRKIQDEKKLLAAYATDANRFFQLE